MPPHLVAVVGCAEDCHALPVMLHLISLLLDLHEETIGKDQVNGICQR